jgi:hypothetical protein
MAAALNLDEPQAKERVLAVKYAVRYETIIHVPAGKTVRDALTEINVPDGDPATTYIEDSFDPQDITDEDGKHTELN